MVDRLFLEACLGALLPLGLVQFLGVPHLNQYSSKSVRWLHILAIFFLLWGIKFVLKRKLYADRPVPSLDKTLRAFFVVGGLLIVVACVLQVAL